MHADRSFQDLCIAFLGWRASGDFERHCYTEMECRGRGGLICDRCDARIEAGTMVVSVVGDNVDFCVDCVVEEALSRVDAGDAGTEMADLLPPNLLKFALNAVPYEMVHSVLQPPPREVEATDIGPPPTPPTHPLRQPDGPQPGGHGGPQPGGHGGPRTGGHSGPRTGGYQTKQDKRKAKKARQKAKRRAAQAPSAAMEHSSPPASPPASLTSSPRRLDVQEMKQSSGERQPNTAKPRTTRSGKNPGAPLTPAARSSSPTAAAAAAAPTPS